MNQEKNKNRSKERNPASNQEKDKTQLPVNKDDFNTGSHSPSSLRNVNAGYDDTGMGSNKKASGKTDADKNGNSGNDKKQKGR